MRLALALTLTLMTACSGGSGTGGFGGGGSGGDGGSGGGAGGAGGTGGGAGGDGGAGGGVGGAGGGVGGSGGGGPSCGNGVVDPGEQCDGTNLDGLDCADLGFADGTLACVDCDLDRSDCTGGVGYCGNGVVDGSERCDGSLNGRTCADFGENAAGTLFCDDCDFDVEQCGLPLDTCGNGTIESPREDCDGVNLDGEDCESIGGGGVFSGGTLGCNACRFNYSECDAAGPVCGDSTIDVGEECDTLNLNDRNCESLGYDGGFLFCSDCRFMTGKCFSGDTCGNGTVEPGEDCDGSLGGYTCETLGHPGDGTLACNESTCEWDFSGCESGPGLEEFSFCDLSGPACAADLTCAPIGPELSACLAVCSENSECDIGQYCDGNAVLLATLDTTEEDYGVCLGQKDRDFGCLPSAAFSATPEDACSSAGLECTFTGVGYGFGTTGLSAAECEQTCSADAIGTTGTCTPDASGNATTCLPAWTLDDSLLNREPAPSGTTCVDDGDCAAAGSEYRCISFDGPNGPTAACVRPEGRCGVAAPVQTNLVEDALQALPDTSYCNTWQDTRLCSPLADPDATAVVACASLPVGFFITQGANAITCVDDFDCFPFGVTCVDNDTNRVCGFRAGACVAYCESPDGSVGYSCPDGQSCLPAPNPLYFDIAVQLDPTTSNPVLCELPTDCNTTDGYACTNVGTASYCLRPRAICQ